VSNAKPEVVRLTSRT